MKSKIRIRVFKQWYQVVTRDTGYTVAQFLRREDAEYFRDNAGQMPLQQAGIEYKYIPQRGQVIKQINVYP